MPTGSIYEHYEAEYLACTKKAMENMERIPELLPGVERESLVASTSKAIESAEEVVQVGAILRERPERHHTLPRRSRPISPHRQRRGPHA